MRLLYMHDIVIYLDHLFLGQEGLALVGGVLPPAQHSRCHSIEEKTSQPQ